MDTAGMVTAIASCEFKGFHYCTQCIKVIVYNDMLFKIYRPT